MIEISYCPKCHKVLYAEHPTRSIGEPFVLCGNCFSYINIANKQTEWFLMSDFRKLSLIFVFVYTSIFYSLIPSIIIAMMIGFIFNVKVNDQIFISSFIMVLLFVFLFFFKGFLKEIKLSIERSKNIDYMKKLQKLGYLNEYEYKPNIMYECTVCHRKFSNTTKYCSYCSTILVPEGISQC